MKVNAKLKNLRISPQKVRLVADLVKGLDVNEAIVQLDQLVKKSSHPMKKLISGAVSNAENNFGMDKNNLYIQEIQVGEGPILKRWMPRAYGRATSILKRTSNVYLVIEEKIEGKNRKSKDELEKERKEREKASSAKKGITEGREKTEEKVEDKEKEPKKEDLKEHKEVEGKRKQSREAGWSKKMFRRKSN